jgi:hypothetical protein
MNILIIKLIKLILTTKFFKDIIIFINKYNYYFGNKNNKYIN